MEEKKLEGSEVKVMHKILEKSKSCGAANKRWCRYNIGFKGRPKMIFRKVMPTEIHSETCTDIGIIPGSVVKGLAGFLHFIIARFACTWEHAL